MLAKAKPKLVLVCIIYYLDEQPGGSWADSVLAALGYDRDPAHLQQMIRTVFRLATSRIRIPGTTVVGVPMFETLDGKDHGDYKQRVEPSVAGGRKMANDFVQRIERACAGLRNDSSPRVSLEI